MLSICSHSIISQLFIRDLIIERYNLGNKIECLFLLQGLNDTYLITSESLKYIFRLYRYGRRSKDAILCEIDYISHLEQTAAPVAGIVADQHGDTIQVIECPEGSRYGMLMRCAANTEVETHCILNGDSLNYGKSIARLHRSAADYAPNSNCTKIDTDHLIWQPLKRIEKTFAEKTEDIIYLNKIAKILEAKILSLEVQGLSKIFIHGDLTGGNSSLMNDKEFVFFDFDCCGYGWRLYDLAVFLWSCLLNQKEKTLWEPFLDGYRSEAKLSKNDLLVVPLLAAARNFWIIGYSISQMSIKGTLSYKARQLDQDINYFRARGRDLGI